ncbi:hypothetical protein F8388_002015 [Cannabis sativa]|uniref:Uncharacterized protein n=1 Tax=Cannabis sativa TaxID=3483 RepID=A0A7J6FLH4_CANSA|nr:hypothetical protein F8388_002015 [Cannabis sativa]
MDIQDKIISGAMVLVNLSGEKNRFHYKNLQYTILILCQLKFYTFYKREKGCLHIDTKKFKTTLITCNLCRFEDMLRAYQYSDDPSHFPWSHDNCHHLHTKKERKKALIRMSRKTSTHHRFPISF